MKKSAIVLLHIGYWTLYLLLISSFLVIMPAGYIRRSLSVLSHILFVSRLTIFVIFPGLLGFYSFYFFLFPRFLNTKKIINLFFAGILVSVICAILSTAILIISSDPGWYVNNGWGSTIGLILFISILALVHGIIGLVMRGFITWFGDIKLKEDLNKRNYEVELALVKSQINPHFLFNTINNIDVLIEKDASKASMYLNKLSDIMRFMLYETKTDQIPLAKELAYIEKFIELQKIRTSNPYYVNYAVEGDTGNLMIAPMLFIPFIENAFKHAENKKIENAINIKVAVEKDTTTFYCENKYNEKTHIIPDHSGIGNELIQKRLALLYPGKHILKVTTENGTFKIKLILQT